MADKEYIEPDVRINGEEIEELVDRLVEEKLEEIELPQFAQDTADAIVELANKLEKLKKEV